MTVLLGVSGRAFCAVTTLPPPEQAAAESREQLAGHGATEQPPSLKKNQQPGAVNSRRSAPPLSRFNPPIQNWSYAVLLRSV